MKETLLHVFKENMHTDTCVGVFPLHVFSKSWLTYISRSCVCGVVGVVCWPSIGRATGPSEVSCFALSVTVLFLVKASLL